MKIILQGVTGSKAYGLDTPQSDTDKKAVYVAPSMDLVSLHPPKDTFDYHNPDLVIHELGKFVNLALACNPTILEMLYLDNYEVLTVEGASLVNARNRFLSKKVSKTYGGYAIAQVKRLEKRGDSFSSDTKNRYSKHARHCFRLLLQGKELLETGCLKVRVSPETREELFAVGQLPPEQLVEKFEAEYAAFQEVAERSVLPEQPDTETVNGLLRRIRMANL